MPCLPCLFLYGAIRHGISCTRTYTVGKIHSVTVYFRHYPQPFFIEALAIYISRQFYPSQIPIHIQPNTTFHTCKHFTYCLVLFIPQWMHVTMSQCLAFIYCLHYFIMVLNCSDLILCDDGLSLFLELGRHSGVLSQIRLSAHLRKVRLGPV